MFDYYIGIDPSITGTSITIMSEDKSFIETHFLTEVKKYKPFGPFHPTHVPDSWRNNGTEHFYNYLTNAVVSIVQEYADKNAKISLEGYSFSSTGKVFSIAEYIGLLKHKFAIIRSWYFDVYPPAAIKKFILKGNSNKTDLFNNFMVSRHIRELEVANPN